MKREDTLPWYRQFWPWFIISLPAATVVAGGYTLWLAMQTDDSLVIHADDGISTATKRNAAAEQQARILGLTATIRIDSDSGATTVELTANDTIDNRAPLRLEVAHPTLARRDAVIDLDPAMPNSDGTPTWAGHFVNLPTGRRYLILSSGDHWRLLGEWSGEPLLTVSSASDGAH